MNNGNSRLFDVTDTALAVIVDSACASVTVQQHPASAAWHRGPAASCVTAQSAGDVVTFTGPFAPGEIAGYVKLDAAGTVQFLRTEVTSVNSQKTGYANGISTSTIDATGVATIAGNIAANGGVTVPTAKTVALVDADSLTVGGKKVPQTFVVSGIPLIVTPAQKGNAFIAHRACKVVAIKEVHSVVAGGGVTLALRKITDTSAPDAAAGANVKELLSAALALDSTINTNVAGALSATAGDLTFAAGDRLCWSGSAALTSYEGTVVVEMQAV